VHKDDGHKPLRMAGRYRGPGRNRYKWYRWTGEKRPPKEGEYFLSGSVIEAYRAAKDGTTPCCIAVEVPASGPCRCCGRA